MLDPLLTQSFLSALIFAAKPTEEALQTGSRHRMGSGKIRPSPPSLQRRPMPLPTTFSLLRPNTPKASNNGKSGNDKNVNSEGPVVGKGRPHPPLLLRLRRLPPQQPWVQTIPHPGQHRSMWGHGRRRNNNNNNNNPHHLLYRHNNNHGTANRWTRRQMLPCNGSPGRNQPHHPAHPNRVLLPRAAPPLLHRIPKIVEKLGKETSTKTTTATTTMMCGTPSGGCFASPMRSGT